MDDVVHQAGILAGKIIETCSLQMNGSSAGLVIGHTSLSVEAPRVKVPKARIVARALVLRTAFGIAHSDGR